MKAARLYVLSKGSESRLLYRKSPKTRHSILRFNLVLPSKNLIVPLVRQHTRSDDTRSVRVLRTSA